jgi:hypothetical protein
MQKKIATKIKVCGTAMIYGVEISQKRENLQMRYSETRSATTHSNQRSDDKDAVVSGNEQRSQWNASLKDI